MLDINSENDMLKIINDFYIHENSKEGILKVLSKVCVAFEISRLNVIVYNADMKKYLQMYEFNSKDGFINHAQKMNVEINQCVNVLFSELNENQNNFIEILNENNLYTDDYSKISNIMENIGFKCENEENLTDFFVFQAKTLPYLFAYTTFERVGNHKLTSTQIENLAIFCRGISDKMSVMIKEKKYQNEISMKSIVLNKEEIPMAVVEKNTYKVLYYNDFFAKTIPNVKVGEICEEINKYMSNCKECPVEKNVLIDYYEVGDQQWLRKYVPFTLSNEREAYMIYSKNSTDYINQIEAVDKLTKALLLKGFEEYYKGFVQRSNDNYALCTLDIDKFKYINTVFGYEVGDEVLKKVANVISNFIDNEESFCRIGEDKFSIIMHYEDDIDLHLKLRELAGNFEGMRDEHFADARITIIGGVTIVDKSLSLNTLLDQSTMARKSAKGSLKNKFSYYNEELDLNLRKEIQIEEQIPHALANDEFNAFLQPKFDMTTKKICGAEALVRWITPKGMIFPDQFIPLFEKNGFILTLDFIIYEKVMEYIRKCLDENLPVYPISVNVSRNHIKDKHFIDKFMDLVNKYDIPHEFLELEVTESVFVEDRKELKHFIDRIKEQDLKVSIDDFGTAYSSLQTLTDVNVDILKIDKGFLDNVNCEDTSVVSKDEILIKNIINLAKDLDFKVICEGVETDEQIELLKKIGCEFGQGYVFARPMPISDYQEKFIRVD